jgi:hypothetical protein
MDAWVVDAPKIHVYYKPSIQYFNPKHIVAQDNLMACMHGKAKLHWKQNWKASIRSSKSSNN